MLEEWTLRPQYAGHYSSCAPEACTYMIKSQAALLYVISTIISFVGGLVVTFRLLVPLAVRFGHWIVLRGRHQNLHTQSNHVAPVEGEMHSDTFSNMLDEALPSSKDPSSRTCKILAQFRQIRVRFLQET